ncbi:MAG: hypothetical protein ACYSTL_00700, partial [Planctomycetota bacterium]
MPSRSIKRILERFTRNRQLHDSGISPHSLSPDIWVRRWRGIERLEPRLLLAGTTYSPGGDGVIGSQFLGDLTLNNDDRVLIDLNAQTLNNDLLQISNTLNLGGVLDLNLINSSFLQIGDTFNPISLTSGNIGGSFLAVDGLEATAGLDLVAIQGPSDLTLVATDLPTGDFTIVVDEQTEVNALVNFFSVGTTNGTTDSVNVTGSIYALGQSISGGLAFTESLDVSVAFLTITADTTGLPVGQESKVTLNSGGFDLIDVFGTGTFELRSRTDTTSGGLRLGAGGFAASGYTLAPAVGGTGTPASNDSTGTIGPLTLTKLNAALGGFTFYDQEVNVSVGFSASKAEFDFAPSTLGGTDGEGDTNPGGITAKATVVSGTFGVGADYDSSTGVSGLSGTGAFAFSASTFDLEVPDVLKASAIGGITYTYDPDGPENQDILTIGALTVELPSLNVTGSITPPSGSTDPGLVVRGDGFKFGSLTVTLDTGGSPDGSLTIGSLVKLQNPGLNITDFEITYGATNSFNGSFSLFASSLRLGPQTGDFYAQGTGLVTTLTFTDNIPDGIILKAGSISFQLGSYISASGTNIVFNPTAAAGEEFLDVNGTLTATLNLDSLFSGTTGLSMSGSVGKFAIMGDGTFVPDAGFSVGFSVNASNLDDLLPAASFPSYLPIVKDLGGSIQISWPDFDADPSRFLILLSLSAGGSIGPVTINGSITNLAIDTAKIDEGKFPIIDIESFSISASADPVFGGSLSGSLLMGTVKFNDQGERLPASTGITNPDEIAETVIYVGITGEFTIANRGGFKLMFGLSELGPLMAYVKADVPILLEPNSGLTLSGFRGGITFNASPFPNITDPVDLRSPMFKPARSLTDEEWLTSLQQLVVNQMGGNPGY